MSVWDILPKNQPLFIPQRHNLMFSIGTYVLFNQCRVIDKKNEVSFLCVHVRSCRQVRSKTEYFKY